MHHINAMRNDNVLLHMSHSVFIAYSVVKPQSHCQVLMSRCSHVSHPYGLPNVCPVWGGVLGFTRFLVGFHYILQRFTTYRPCYQAAQCHAFTTRKDLVRFTRCLPRTFRYVLPRFSTCVTRDN
jgi:hypothetical protein